MPKYINPDLEQFGQRLREMRLDAGYKSQQAFTDEHKFSRCLYANWESGKGNITYKNLVAVCRVLNVPLSKFFDPFTK